MARMSTAEAGRYKSGLEGRQLRLLPSQRRRGRNEPNPPMMTKPLFSTSGPISRNTARSHCEHKTDSGLAPDQKSTHDAAVHTTSIAALNDDKAAPRRIEHDRTMDGNDLFARSHDDWVIQFCHARQHPMEGSEDRGHDHHSNSGELNTHDAVSRHGAPDFEPSTRTMWRSAPRLPASMGHRDSFHFKDKVSVLEVSDAAEVHHGPAPSGYRGHAARTSEPPAISEAAIEMASPGHHASDNSNHHWFDHIGNGPDHAWSGANNHAQHHDLLV